jgi:hypothetical protein
MTIVCIILALCNVALLLVVVRWYLRSRTNPLQTSEDARRCILEVGVRVNRLRKLLTWKGQIDSGRKLNGALMYIEGSLGVWNQDIVWASDEESDSVGIAALLEPIKMFEHRDSKRREKVGESYAKKDYE